tara:strand:+ start:1653 stop:1841 length:189 start_codon:yes stop_codon:yes gene_type:complete
MTKEKSLEDRFLDALDGSACDVCGEYKDDVDWELDPYQEDVNGVTYMRWLCVDCYNNLCMEI